MNYEQILMYVVALILGMLFANMLKDLYGCKLVEGQSGVYIPPECADAPPDSDLADACNNVYRSMSQNS